MAREELQREMLRRRAGCRAWGYEKRLKRGGEASGQGYIG